MAMLLLVALLDFRGTGAAAATAAAAKAPTLPSDSDCLVLLQQAAQVTSKSSREQAEFEAERNLANAQPGSSAPISENGYKLVAALRDDVQMKSFMHRVVEKETSWIKETHKSDGAAGADKQLEREIFPIVDLEKRQTNHSPMCVADLKEDDPFWNATSLMEDHNYLYDGGKYKVSNRERIDALRSLLDATVEYLNRFQVHYVLYSGTAIGQQRCRDILPFDYDVDVVVSLDDTLKLPLGPMPNTRYTVIDLGSPLNKLIPRRVIDTKAGWATDIFVWSAASPKASSAATEGASAQAEDAQHWTYFIPWPSAEGGGQECPQFGSWYDKTMHCESYSKDVLYPRVPCEFSGKVYTCASNQPAFLDVQYAVSGWKIPDERNTLKTDGSLAVALTEQVEQKRLDLSLKPHEV